MGIDLFKKPVKCLDPYDTGVESVGTGIDFRKELHDILYTDNEGSDVIFRRARMVNGQPEKCECTKNNRSHEPDKDIPCDVCSGLGYYYDDIFTRTYINHSQAYSIYKKGKPAGDMQTEYRTSYFEWDFIKNSLDDGHNIPTRFDRVIQLQKDLTGKLLSPTKPREIYDILSVDPYRLDNNGRIEYYRIRIISVIDKSFLV